MNSEDLARFEAQSFLFACGKLDAAEQAWMISMIAAHPELAEAAHADRVLVEHTRAAIDERAAAHTQPLVPFEALPKAGAAKQGPRPSMQSWRQRLMAWWQRPAAGAWAFASIAALALLAGVQTLRLEQLDAGANAPVFRGSEGSSATTGPLIQAVFADGVTLGELRKTLTALKLEIVRGPDDQGMVWITVREGDTQQALDRLRATSIVLDARIIRPRP
ncbi:hypothetical protein ACS15_3251 [Ralstonia insidiosa]|uniref:Uncharacterized protein n=1 Tax=Ralstonia insidiosa TaxID=190721 RepID=A0AAC9BFG7_9RALS|nr:MULTISPECIES: hypothetical protein [Ralstonia]ANH71553.1 hypothetical protein ACS15_3251 [Ralstonia insidiosa]EPX94903.1 hypothetical protein C404_26715 [Ralstonia sp. AU12-08]